MAHLSTHYLLDTANNFSLIHTLLQYSIPIPIFIGKEMSSERLSNLPKEQLLSGTTIQTQICLSPKATALSRPFFKMAAIAPFKETAQPTPPTWGTHLRYFFGFFFKILFFSFFSPKLPGTQLYILSCGSFQLWHVGRCLSMV